MFPNTLTPRFIDCLFDVLPSGNPRGRDWLGGRAHLCHTRVGFMVIVLDDPVSYSPKDPILACFSVGLLECYRSDAPTLIDHASSRFPRHYPFIAM